MGYILSSQVGPIPYLADSRHVPPIMAWVVLAAPVAIVFTAGTLVLARSLLTVNRSSRNFALAGVACYLGVVAAEVLEAQLMRWNVARSLQGVVEEGLELTGTTLFFTSFVEVLKSRSPVAERSMQASIEEAR